MGFAGILGERSLTNSFAAASVIVVTKLAKMQAAGKRKTPAKKDDGGKKKGDGERESKKLKVSGEDKKADLSQIRKELAERNASEIAGMMKDGVLIRLLSTDSFYTALAVCTLNYSFY